MGGKPSGKINSGWSSHHVHRQETRQPRRGRESYAGTAATDSSFDTVSNASSMGSSSCSKSDRLYYEQSRSNVSSMGNTSRTGSCESLPRSRTNSFDSRSNASSSKTAPEWHSRSAFLSSRSDTFDSRSSASSSMAVSELFSRGSIPSSRTNTNDSRSNASCSTEITEALSRLGLPSVGSSSNRPTWVDSFSRKAFLAHEDVQANRRLNPPEWLRANTSNTGAYRSLDVQVNRQPKTRMMLNHPGSSLDHSNVTFEQQIQWPGYSNPPPALVLKINCAGVFSASSQQAGFGAVIRTQEGYFLAAFSGKLAACEHAIVAEISAIKEGLRLAAWMKLQEVEVRSDYLFLITELQNPGDSWHAIPYQQLLNEIKALAATFKNCKFLHIRQEANSVAYWLAMYGFFVETIQSWFYAAPNFLLPALQHDVYSGYTY